MIAITVHGAHVFASTCRQCKLHDMPSTIKGIQELPSLCSSCTLSQYMQSAYIRRCSIAQARWHRQ